MKDYRDMTTKEELLALAPNIYKEPVSVWHSQLARTGESLFRSKCPCCEYGMLMVTREPVTLNLSRLDRCVSCGQHVLYQDLEIANEKPIDNYRLPELP